MSPESTPSPFDTEPRFELVTDVDAIHWIDLAEPEVEPTDADSRASDYGALEPEGN